MPAIVFFPDEILPLDADALSVFARDNMVAGFARKQSVGKRFVLLFQIRFYVVRQIFRLFVEGKLR